ncbi:hypothetical protein QQZ08_003160 [Neonectria magnoliae]|uniref:Bacterial bifunctional deaminase-reductase C-terminal domain-containing protein n=1 Tax=Neonectria magnoliae TaxID=2732573 RepID=A0ABR1IC88_9HYPO
MRILRWVLPTYLTRPEVFGLGQPWETVVVGAAERTDAQDLTLDHELNQMKPRDILHETKGGVDGMMRAAFRTDASDFVIGGVVGLTEIHDQYDVIPCPLWLANASESDVSSEIASRRLLTVI